MSKKKQKDVLERIREALLPTPVFKLPDDPLKVVWEYNGVMVEYKPRGWLYRWYRGGNMKLILLAVATLQAQGVPATRGTILEQLGGTFAYTTLGRNLAALATMTDRLGLSPDYTIHTHVPLQRVKKGRCYHYFIVEPCSPS